MSEHSLGLHDSLSFEQYLKAAGINRGALLDIHPPSTPAHFKSKWIDGNREEEDTAALRMGRFTHLMLTPDLLKELVIQPETYPAKAKRKDDPPEEKPWNWNATYCQEWREQQTGEVIKQAEWNDLHGMWKAVREHDLAGKLLRVSDCERSAFAKDPKTGLLLKCRFDGVPRGSNLLWDLKTCESADEESASKFMANYKVWYQAAFYRKVANLIGLERQLFSVVMVEKKPPYCVAVWDIDFHHLEAGELIVDRDLARLAECMASGKFPGYHSGSQTIGLPKWEVESEGLEQVA